MHCLVVEQDALLLIVIDEQIVRYVQFLYDIQFLIHTTHASCFRDHRVAQMYLLAINEDFTFIRLVNAGKNLNQCGLAGAVFADESMYQRRGNIW